MPLHVCRYIRGAQLSSNLVQLVRGRTCGDGLHCSAKPPKIFLRQPLCRSALIPRTCVPAASPPISRAFPFSRIFLEPASGSSTPCFSEWHVWCPVSCCLVAVQIGRLVILPAAACVLLVASLSGDGSLFAVVIGPRPRWPELAQWLHAGHSSPGAKSTLSAAWPQVAPMPSHGTRILLPAAASVHTGHQTRQPRRH